MTTLGYRERHVNGVRGVRPDPAEGTHPQPLVAAARALIAGRAGPPTVEQAAEAASVSRTTAYRYFPSQKALLIAAHPEIRGGVAAARRRRATTPWPGSLVAIEAFVDADRRHRGAAADDAAALTRERRHGPAAAAGPGDRLVRGGARPAASHGSARPSIHRLAVAIRSAVGIESLVWLTDIAGLSRPEATERMLWTTRALLAQALADADGTTSAG